MLMLFTRLIKFDHISAGKVVFFSNHVLGPNFDAYPLVANMHEKVPLRWGTGLRIPTFMMGKQIGAR